MPSRVNASLRRHPRTAPHRPQCMARRLELGARRRCALRCAEARHVARSIACVKSSSARSEAALATAVALSSDACHCSHAKRVSASACSAARTVAHCNGAVRGRLRVALCAAVQRSRRAFALDRQPTRHARGTHAARTRHARTRHARGTHAARTHAARTHARGTHARGTHAARTRHARTRHARGTHARTRRRRRSERCAPRAAPSLPPPPARRCRCRRPHAPPPPPPPLCRAPTHRRTPRGANRPQQDKTCALTTSQQTITQEAHRPIRPTAALLRQISGVGLPWRSPSARPWSR
jgi:hypothetical protein